MGAQTTVATPGALTNVVALNRATGQHTEITVGGGFDWTPYVNKMVKITASANPANVGATAWIQASLGGGAARVAAFQATVYTTPATTSWSTMTLITPQVGDTVEIMTLAPAIERPIIAFGVGTALAGTVTYEDFAFSAPTTTQTNAPQGGSNRFLRCSMSSYTAAGEAFHIFNNCFINSISTGDYGSIVDIRGGLLTSSFLTIMSTRLGSDLMLSAGTFSGFDASFMATIGNVAVASVSTIFMTVPAGGFVTFTPGTTLYGTTTSNRAAFQLSAGSRIVTPTGVVPTLATGGGANISLRNGVTKTWADLATYYVNPANGAAILPDVA